MTYTTAKRRRSAEAQQAQLVAWGTRHGLLDYSTPSITRAIAADEQAAYDIDAQHTGPALDRPAPLHFRVMGAGNHVAADGWSVRRDPNASNDNRWSLRLNGVHLSSHRLVQSAKNRAETLRAEAARRDQVNADHAEANRSAASRAQINAWLARHDIALREMTVADAARVAAAYHAAIAADHQEALDAVAADLAARPELLREQPQQQQAQLDTPALRPTPEQGITAKGGRATLLDLTRAGVDIGELAEAVEARTVVRLAGPDGTTYSLATTPPAAPALGLADVAEADLPAKAGKLVTALDGGYLVRLYADVWMARPPIGSDESVVDTLLVNHAVWTGAVRVESEGPRLWLSLPPVRRNDVVTVTPRQDGPQFDVLADYDGSHTDQLVHVARRNVPEGVESGASWVGREYVRHVKAGDVEPLADDEQAAPPATANCPQCRMGRPVHKPDCSDPSRQTDDPIVIAQNAEQAGATTEPIGDVAVAEALAHAEQAARDHEPTIYARCVHAAWVMLAEAGWKHLDGRTCPDDAPLVQPVDAAEVWFGWQATPPAPADAAPVSAEQVQQVADELRAIAGDPLNRSAVSVMAHELRSLADRLATPTIAEMILPAMPEQYRTALSHLLAGDGFAAPAVVDALVADDANPDAFLIHDRTGVAVGVYDRYVRLSYPAAHAGAPDDDGGTAHLDLAYGTSYETVADVAIGLVTRVMMSDVVIIRVPDSGLSALDQLGAPAGAAEAARTAAEALPTVGQWPGDRSPYVGEGADGARRSAEIDRAEADTYTTGSDMWQQRMDSARQWDEQADRLAATEATVAAWSSDVVDAAGYLPCGCHGSQREHSCGPRETADQDI